MADIDKSKQAINDYLAQQAYRQARDVQSEYTGTTFKKRGGSGGPNLDPTGTATLGRRMREAFGERTQKRQPSPRERDESRLISRLFGAMSPASPKPVKQGKRQFEGMHTSILPKLSPEGVPLEYLDDSKADKPKPEKPPNFQRLQDNVRRQKLAQLGSIERAGQHISNIGNRVNNVGTGWPYIPGGVILPLGILALLVFILLPVNGNTRIGWLWLTITGHAGVNPNYVPPVPDTTPTPAPTGAIGSGPDYPTYANEVNTAPPTLYNYIPLSMSTYMDEY